MSSILLGILNAQSIGGAGGLSGFAFSGTGNDSASKIRLDSSGNILMVGTTNSVGAGNNDVWLVKLDTDFNILWQKAIGDGNNQYTGDVRVDSLDNIFVTLHNFGTVSLLKFNSAGTLQWQRYYYFNGGNNQYPLIYLNLDNDVWLVWEFAINNNDGTAATWGVTSSGTTIGRSYYQVAQPSDSFGGIAAYANDQYWAVHWSRSVSPTSIEIQKIDSDFLTRLGGYRGHYITSGGSSVFTGSMDALFDSNGDVVSALYCNASNGIAKFDGTTGSNIWARILTGPAFGYSVAGIARDSSDNYYIAGLYNSQGIVAKYNTSGVLQWQRSFTVSGSTTNFNGIHADDDFVYLTGQTGAAIVAGSGNRGYFIKVPTDGSGAATYTSNGVDLIYAESTLTDDQGTWSEALSTVNPTAGSPGEAVATWPINSVTMPNTTTF